MRGRAWSVPRRRSPGEGIPHPDSLLRVRPATGNRQVPVGLGSAEIDLYAAARTGVRVKVTGKGAALPPSVAVTLRY